MNKQDSRWVRRFNNFAKAFAQLREAVELSRQRELSNDRERGTPMTTRFGLSEATIQKICAVLARYPQVEKAVLYGSRATGSYRNGSDIDLALFGDDITLRTLCSIMDAIDDLLLPYSVDLVIYGQILDPDLRAHIQQAGVVFYQRAEAAPTH